MPLYPAQKNIASITGGIRTNLVNRTGISNFDRDSKAKAFSDSISQEIIELQQSTQAAFDARDELSATGEALRKLARSKYGLESLPQTFAQARDSERVLQFYVDSGNFGAINGAADITIPAGETVWSEPSENELGRRVTYTLTSGLVCLAAASSAFASVKANVSGSIGNVGAGVLINHSFTSYTDVANRTLKCRNLYPVVNGREQETDPQLRARMSQRYASIGQANQARVSLVALDVPGVISSRIIPDYFGIGTTGVVVLGPDNQTTLSLLGSVQARLDAFKAPGAYVVAVSATQVSVDIRLKLKTTRPLTQLERGRVEGEVKRLLMRTLSNKGLGEQVGLDELASQLVLAGNGLLVWRGSGENRTLFNKVWVRRGDSTTAPDERELVVSETLPIQDDEFYALGTLEIEY